MAEQRSPPWDHQEGQGDAARGPLQEPLPGRPRRPAPFGVSTTRRARASSPGPSVGRLPPEHPYWCTRGLPTIRSPSSPASVDSRSVGSRSFQPRFEPATIASPRTAKQPVSERVFAARVTLLLNRPSTPSIRSRFGHFKRDFARVSGPCGGFAEQTCDQLPPLPPAMPRSSAKTHPLAEESETPPRWVVTALRSSGLATSISTWSSSAGMGMDTLSFPALWRRDPRGDVSPIVYGSAVTVMLEGLVNTREYSRSLIPISGGRLISGGRAGIEFVVRAGNQLASSASGRGRRRWNSSPSVLTDCSQPCAFRLVATVSANASNPTPWT